MFARIANTAEGRQFEWILVCLPAGKTYSEVTPRGEFLCVIDDEVALELKGKVFVLHAGDSARDQSTVPYSWSDNGGKGAVFVQVGAPRLF